MLQNGNIKYGLPDISHNYNKIIGTSSVRESNITYQLNNINVKINENGDTRPQVFKLIQIDKTLFYLVIRKY